VTRFHLGVKTSSARGRGLPSDSPTFAHRVPRPSAHARIRLRAPRFNRHAPAGLPCGQDKPSGKSEEVEVARRASRGRARRTRSRAWLSGHQSRRGPRPVRRVASLVTAARGRSAPSHLGGSFWDDTDEEALEMVRRAAPFPSLPNGVSQDIVVRRYVPQGNIAALARAGPGALTQSVRLGLDSW
jgi:hypothetical protein